MSKTISLDDLAMRYGVDREEKSSPKKNFSNKKNFNKNAEKKSLPVGNATAPYNFVSLPEKILPAPVKDVETFIEQIKSGKNFSGEIELNIETLTPLFIGGNFFDSTKSFSPIDENFPIIPGSSLRGMFKNIFKIVTCGAFRGKTSQQKKGVDFNDEHVYFRCLMTTKNSPAWMDDLNKLYNDRMTSKREGKLVKNARPGFLIQTTDGKFFIAPSIYRTDKKDDRILIKEYEKIFHEEVKIRNDSRVTWHGRDAYIITGSQPEFKLHDEKSYERVKKEDKKEQGKQFIRFTKIDYVDWSKNHWLELPDEVRMSYEHDRNRKGVNLFKVKGILKREKVEELTKKNLPDLKTLIPCHFLEEGGQVTAFGHGQCFRIPYKNSIGDVVPKNLKENIVDFSDAIFGLEKFWASRVFFDDAKSQKKIETLEKFAAHPLMQPNPTSYQLYLKQGDEKLNHWDSKNAELRGYKLYWHNNFAAELDLDKGKPAEKIMTKDLTPLKKGNIFKSKIRFQNLSEIELGALLMIFDLNGAKNPAYKIGMGKPLGFGSIKVTPKLFVEDETAYTEIFDENGFKNPYREENFKKYLDAFKNYIKSCGMEKIWLDVMNELNLILDFDKTKTKNWGEKIKSMSGNVSDKNGVDVRFKNRAPLPTIFEVVK